MNETQEKVMYLGISATIRDDNLSAVYSELINLVEALSIHGRSVVYSISPIGEENDDDE